MSRLLCILYSWFRSKTVAFVRINTFALAIVAV